MQKRPKIELQITPTYAKEGDTKALQFKKLIALAVKMSDAKNKREDKNSLNIELLETIYTEAQTSERLLALQEKIVKEHGAKEFEMVYFETLMHMCTDLQKVSLSELEALAQKRAESMVTYLTHVQGIDKKRVILNNIAEDPEGGESVAMQLDIGVK